MSFFRRIDDQQAYSELKPERCPLHEVVSESQAAERRRIFMQEIPLPLELEQPRQRRGRK